MKIETGFQHRCISCQWCGCKPNIHVWHDNVISCGCDNNSCMVNPETSNYTTIAKAIEVWSKQKLRMFIFRPKDLRIIHDCTIKTCLKCSPEKRGNCQVSAVKHACRRYLESQKEL